MDDRRSFCVLVASEYLGQPYIWGGDDHDEGGFDCSGLVNEVFTRLGVYWPELLIPRWSANSIYNHFVSAGAMPITDAGGLKPGCLVFFRRRPGSRMFHVKIHISSGPFGNLAIDAGGAGSDATNLSVALRRGAGVRMSESTIHGSADWIAIDPFALGGGDHDPLGEGV